ncbi:MAG: phosphoribosylanthranilate isomerase [Haloferacaceae archaeon]
MVRAKICGITREADLQVAAEAGADAVGVVSDVGVDTPREVPPARAADLVASAPPFVTTVLVTMPESVDRAVELAGAVEPDALQLHCDFSPDELRFVRAETSSRLLVAVGADEPERAEAYDDVADAILVDSASESGGGGTGETHDWTATRDLAADLSSPVVLAGGLTPENVAEAVATAEPYAVDVASGVEASGGVKDHDAVRTFVRRARRTRGVEA